MPEQAKPAERTGHRGTVDWPGLTVEVVLYAVLIIGAAFVRLYDLGRWPLLRGEAAEALAAWRFLHAQGVSGSPTPFLFGGALAGFFAFGASDAVARLVPAVLGTSLVLLPLALRRRLGSWGALAAAFMLAFSPVLVFYSRTLAGPAPALAGLGAMLVAADWAAQGRLRRARTLGALGLAVGLTSSPWVYAFILAALLFLGLGRLAARRGSPWPGWEEGRQAWESVARDRYTWGALAIPLALFSTAALLRTGGLQGTADLLAAWLGRLLPGSGGHSWAYALGTLAYYDLGILLLGLGGLVIGLRRRQVWAGFLGLWVLVALLPATAAGARDAGPGAFAVLPLALLGGVAVTEIVARLRRPQWAWAGGTLAVLAVLFGFWWLQLAAYGNVEAGAGLLFSVPLVVVLVVATPLVIAAAALAFRIWVGRAETAWALTILGGLLLGSLLLRQCVSLNFAHARDAREPLLSDPTSLGVRDMVAFLEDWSVRTTLDQYTLPIAVEADLAPVIPWYLRDFRDVQVTPSPLVEPRAEALVLRAEPQQPLVAGYARQRYYVSSILAEPAGSIRQALGWWLLGVGGGTVQAEACELWIKP